MNIGALLGTLMQSGMTSSTTQRLESALGGRSGGLLESLGSMLGGQQAGSGLGGALPGTRASGSGNLGGMLGDVLQQVERSVGGKQNVALGGLGALAGALLGGGKKSMGGALGGGVMALLGAMAMKALQGSSQASGRIPQGLLEPQNTSEQQDLEREAELVLRAMINAAKADGQIDRQEIERIVGKLQEVNADQEDQRFVSELLRQPMETEALFTAAQGQPERAAQLYAASLMAIEVNTPAERTYLQNLAAGLRLSPEVTGRIEQMVGLQASPV
ncbi:tellurite resistance TerB family protein [Desulfofustis limnaeus]|jgi:uncharacterized membrane protein YebE (DUF533 family)|uniref:Tellurite resistance TerB family protein n=1 Tax=Desulfofustis limnaeus TaxID=2740163 RepID=A0ABM7WBD1_9BACT|nr:DUF533 domain-containing protein [Desulfofustis limnaeus]MDX9896653.1 DUF533 domain-containing protein [Desulfofustis sp.]BDD88240.1 hypothetical protein DPPLL_26050 [Desulfofustis limnaeus]